MSVRDRHGSKGKSFRSRKRSRVSKERERGQRERESEREARGKRRRRRRMEDMKKRKLGETENDGEAASEEHLRSLLDPLAKPQLVDLLAKLHLECMEKLRKEL